MKIRSLCLGITLECGDVLDKYLLSQRLTAVARQLKVVRTALQQPTSGERWEVQTIRIACNSFEEWLCPLVRGTEDPRLVIILQWFEELLLELGVDCCSFGPATRRETMNFIPFILSHSSRISMSSLFRSSNLNKEKTAFLGDVPDYSQALAAAQVCLEIHRSCGDLGNFRYCAAFNTSSGSPFFPMAYHELNSNQQQHDEEGTHRLARTQSFLTIGLENGQVLSQAWQHLHQGASPIPSVHNSGIISDHAIAQENLYQLLYHECSLIESRVRRVCREENDEIVYRGLDASINPGLASIEESVGHGIQLLIPQHRPVGSNGTLAAVSTITGALKALGRENTRHSDGHVDPPLTLVGYTGLMLPVMEDQVLAEIAKTPGSLTIRDLLTFSSVCGVGIDTVPVPGNVTAEAIAALYLDVGAMAFRLNKPLSCRLLPMQNKVAGDMTNVDSPYLCNTHVFVL